MTSGERGKYHRALPAVVPRWSALRREGRLPRPSSFVLTLDHVWLAALVALTFATVNAFPVDQTDYWWTVKLGEGLWATGQLPAADPLSFTATRQPYIEQQWLAQLVLAGVHRLGGLEAALLLRAILLSVAMGLLYYACRHAGAGGALSALAVLLALLLTLSGAAMRPQLLAIPLFVLFLVGTTVWLDRRWILLALPLALALWTNLHGSFPLGLALVSLALVGRAWEGRRSRTPLDDARLRRLALLLVLCCAAVLLNPYGVGLLPWLVDFLTLHTGGAEAAVIATEWAPTSLAARAGLYYFASAILLAILLVRGGPPPPADGLRLLAFALLGLVAVRNTLWWGLVQAPVLAWAGARLVRASSPPRQGVARLNALLVAVCALVALASIPSVQATLLGTAPQIADPAQPRRAAEHLAAYPEPLRLFHELDWGGYLAWRLAPRAQIFADGRFGIYPHQVYRDYFGISRAQHDWEARLEAYGVGALVLSRAAQRELTLALAEHRSWRPVYCDEQAIIYLRHDLAGDAPLACPP